MQRILLKCDFTIKYIPGSQTYLVDILSRESSKETGEEDPEMLHVVHPVLKLLPVSENKLKQLQMLTAEDGDLQLVSKFFKEGWPKN